MPGTSLVIKINNITNPRIFLTKNRTKFLVEWDFLCDSAGKLQPGIYSLARLFVKKSQSISLCRRGMLDTRRHDPVEVSAQRNASQMLLRLNYWEKKVYY